MEYVQTLTDQNKILSFTKNTLLVFGLSVLFGLIALIEIPLPFTPVPIVFTLQAIIFSSVFLGKRGAYATWLYLTEGALGFPVLSGGVGGLVHFYGPSGGYLIGWAVLAYVVAILAERLEKKTPLRVFGVMLFGNLLAYVFGVPHLALFVGFERALQLGFYPFIAGCLFKLYAALELLKKMNYFSP